MARGPVAILGAGTQGRRLAYMWSSRGGPVHLIDKDPNQLQDAKLAVDRLRQSNAIRDHMGGVVSGYSVDDRKAALANSWLIVECVPESLKLKRTTVQDLDGLADSGSIIASNSSSYPITEIMQSQQLNHPSRLVSLHSYWPPETPAIEVMPSPTTQPSIVPLLMQECKNHGFSPYHVKKTSTGYIYNRIWAAIKREALSVAEEGVATPQEIDAIYKDVLKTPKGPFEQMDVVGLDVALAIEKHYAAERPGLPESPQHLLERIIAEGRLGVKNGHGFYEYKPENE